MGVTKSVLPDSFEKRRHTFGFEDDFAWYISPHLWTTTATDSGTVAVGDGAKGIVVLTASDGTVADNDEAYLLTTKELFLVSANRPITAECLLQFTEANTDDANVAFMLQNAIAANSILDDGAGLKVSGDTFAIYKVDGGTVWKCVSCVNGTATVSTSTKTAGGADYQRLRILIQPLDATRADVTFEVDGVPLIDANVSSRNMPIKHTITYTSATEMMVGVGVKNGGANLEVVNVDYVSAYQTR